MSFIHPKTFARVIPLAQFRKQQQEQERRQRIRAAIERILKHAEKLSW